MSLPIVDVPPVLNQLLEPYRKFFTKPQFRHFRRYITGLIVSENKTFQEINDAFGECDQSNLDRFMCESPWSREELNYVRLNQIKDTLSLTKKGILIIDESLLHKSGKKMELAGLHRSGITKRLEWGHMIVNSFYTDTNRNGFPVRSDVYVRNKDCNRYDVNFKTKREIGINQIDYALQAGLPVGLVIADAGYEGSDFTKDIQSRELDFLIGTRTSTKISINRQKRISIAAYLNTLTDANFEMLITEDGAYFYHVRNVSLRGIGGVKLIITYAYGDEENIKCYITNLDEPDEIIMNLLIKRWEIECFHRDAKQNLGLESYQVRKGRGMQNVALTILTAYTLVILAVRILKTPIRSLKTIGEGCRYLKLIAYKGVRWIRDIASRPEDYINIMRKLVFVKNTKV